MASCELCPVAKSAVSLRRSVQGRLSYSIHVPETDRLVVGARCNPLAVRSPGERGDTCKMTLEGVDESAGQCVPDFDRCVGACDGDVLVVTTRLSRTGIRTATCNHRTVRRELNGRHATQMTP